MSGESDDDKQFEASQKRLQDLRREGRLPRSQDLFTASAYAGLLLAFMMTGPAVLRGVRDHLGGMIGDAPALAESFARSDQAAFRGQLVAISSNVLPLMILPIVAVLVMVTLQRAWVFTPANLMPKLSRISPLASARQKFGPAGLFDFSKNTLKLILTGFLLGFFLLNRLDEMIGAMALTPSGVAVILFRLMRDFLAVVLAMTFLVGALDYLWQRFRHLRDARMSRQEMTDEHKESEGDPHTKQQRRQRGREYATNRMLQDVPTADVVMVNPTHYAVALKWDRASGRAPVCVAKGVDEIAARIRERAALSGVPVYRDPPATRQLWREVDIGDEISRPHYKAAAAAIRFAEALRRKKERR